MRRVWQFILLVGGLAGSVSATSILTCNFNGANGGALQSTGCYGGTSSPLTFNTLETVDWQTALGTADQTGAPYTYTTPTQNLGIALSVPAGDSLLRADNFYRYYDTNTGLWKAYNATGSPYAAYNIYEGMFNAQSTNPSNPAIGSPGDHLLGTNGSTAPLTINFDRGISGVEFRISTPTTGDVNATLYAYSVTNPTAGDTPLFSYTINATNAAGLCAGLESRPPHPCNTAPYIGIDGGNGQIRSVVVSTTDTAGMYIDSLFLDDAQPTGTDSPEPATFVLFGGALAGLAVIARRKRRV
jgi:hypothetical protein